RNTARYFVNHSNNNSNSSSEDIASERGFVFFLLSAAFIIFLLAAALVAEATLTPFRRAPVTRHLVVVTCSSCVSPTIVVMRQSYAILSSVTRQMCPPRPRTLEIERLESS